MNTPVVFLVFNRPGVTRKVLERIRNARPSKLLVVGDGPRIANSGDINQVAEVREIIATEVDWPCELSTNFAEENLGCRARVSSGLNWAFSRVEEAIILEDDCLPSQSFFTFAEQLLSYYRSDNRVAHISGDNFQEGRKRTSASYYFSRYTHGWGWATWRRAWLHHDPDLQQWPSKRNTDWLFRVCGSTEEAEYWRRIFDSVYSKEVNTTWDYQWLFACWVNEALGVIPKKNLVTNIGFGPDATHTKETISTLSFPSFDLKLERHPRAVVANREADRFTYLHHYGGFNTGQLNPWRRLLKRCRTQLTRCLL